MLTALDWRISSRSALVSRLPAAPARSGRGGRRFQPALSRGRSLRSRRAGSTSEAGLRILFCNITSWSALATSVLLRSCIPRLAPFCSLNTASSPPN
eukprot:8931400-Pyramimonas_sp.AAC.1